MCAAYSSSPFIRPEEYEDANLVILMTTRPISGTFSGMQRERKLLLRLKSLKATSHVLLSYDSIHASGTIRFGCMVGGYAGGV